MPGVRHNFRCIGCGVENAVDVSPQCGCHECESRRPQNNYYKTMMLLVRSGALIGMIGLLTIPSGCWIERHFDQMRLQASSQAEIEKAKDTAEAEVRKYEALKSLDLGQYEVRPTTTDGKIGVLLVPKKN